MRRTTARLLLVLAALGCAGESGPESDPRVPDTTAAEGERVVVLRDGALRLAPDLASPGIIEVPAGRLLAVVRDTAADGWTRVATWDDRRGWLPDSLVVEAGLWAGYAEALGGVSPVLLRPAYPVEGGRWGVEAPFDSPGFTPASTTWLLGDSARVVRVAAIDTIENFCGYDRHRFAVTERVAAGDHWPLLEAGVVATPSGSRPSARPLAIRPLEPTAALVALGERTAAGLAPPGTGPPASVEWSALGDDAAWAAFSWPAEDEETGQAQLAAAALFARGPRGWSPAGTIAASPSSAEIPTPAWRPAAAYAVHPRGGATILLLETFEYEGAHLDLWIERAGRYARLYKGYYWGC